MTAPSVDVVDAIESGQGIIKRRIEFYEGDGETPWYPDESGKSRLIDGSVTLDATRPERRMMDVTLLNDDEALRQNPNGGFWYDKIIKVFRGIEYVVPTNGPRIKIIEESVDYAALKFQVMLRSLGMTRSFVDNTITDAGSADADVLISYTQTTATDKSGTLKAQYMMGRGVITFSVGNTEAEVPLIESTTAVGAQSWGATPVSTDTPVAGSWTTGVAATSPAGRAVTGTAPGSVAVAVWSSGGGPSRVTVTLASNAQGGKWVDFHLPDFESTGIKQLIRAAVLWIQGYQPKAEWETQLGEFRIDQLDDQSFPYNIKATCRDPMKVMMDSKIEQDETFSAGTPVVDLIVAVARNSGIMTRMNIPALENVLDSDVAYTRNTPRQQIAMDAATGVGYDLYFNNKGELTMTPAPDPTLDPIQHVFKTGADGNLVNFTRSTNDSNLKNHIVVFGTPSGGSGLPYFGEAKNVDPDSPTRIDRIGDRYDQFQYDTVGSDAQAAKIARTLLKVAALETYEMSVSSITYPWLEVNIVSDIIDPRAFDFEPIRYLLSSLTFNLGLGPMSGSAKRITKVGDPGNGDG